MNRRNAQSAGKSDKMKMWKSAYPQTYMTSSVRFALISAICGILAVMVFVGMSIVQDNKLFYCWFGIACVALFVFFFTIAIAWNRAYKKLLLSVLSDKKEKNEREGADYKIVFLNQYKIKYVEGDKELILDIGQSRPFLTLDSRNILKWNVPKNELVEEEERIKILGRIYGLLMYGADTEYVNVLLSEEELNIALRLMDAGNVLQFECQKPKHFALNKMHDQWQVIIEGGTEKTKAFDTEEDACGFLYKEISESYLPANLPEQIPIWNNGMSIINRNNRMLVILLVIILAIVLIVALVVSGNVLYVNGYNKALETMASTPMFY